MQGWFGLVPRSRQHMRNKERAMLEILLTWIAALWGFTADAPTMSAGPLSRLQQHSTVQNSNTVQG